MTVAEKKALERIADALESIAGNGDREAASPDFGTMSGPTDAHAGGAAQLADKACAVVMSPQSIGKSRENLCATIRRAMGVAGE